jgi:ethanolamine utilization protein EutA
MTEAEQGGRIFFSSAGRSLVEEDELVVLSAGVDIGSSTSHLVFSRIVLERLDSRYLVTTREIFYQSGILLTPYCAAEEIDAQALGSFIKRQYEEADVHPDEIDTGALILTGVAVRRQNARSIGELFARQAGKMVAVSAGDSLESVMAAHGSGAVARSIRDQARVMNVDVGGGTSKIAICCEGRVRDVTALDVGARLVCLDAGGRIVRIEEAGHRFAAEIGRELQIGRELAPAAQRALAALMADRLLQAMAGGAPKSAGSTLLRLEPLTNAAAADQITFSGGVAEYIYGRETQSYGDLGAPLAQEINNRLGQLGIPLKRSNEGIRATVIGASQYTTQISGSTIFISPLEALPLRNVPVIAPAFAPDMGAIDPEAVASAVRSVLRRLDLADTNRPVAVFVPWHGSATFARLDGFCRGILDGLARVLRHRQPLVLAGDGDVGGLIGIHLREELRLANPIISIDGLELKEFDYIDIGAMLPNSGAVPVVIKSLIFPQ